MVPLHNKRHSLSDRGLRQPGLRRTALTLNDTGLTVQTIYYYVLQTTDSATPTPAVVLSVVLTAPTHGNTTVKIAFIGDSITYGAESTVSPPTAYGLALQAAYPQLDVQIYNYGFSGQEFRYYSRLSYPGGTNGSSGVIGLLTTLQAAGITYLCIEEGTNDCYNRAAMYGTDTSMTPTNYAADMVDVTGYLTSHGITCFVNEIIYRGTTMDNATTGIPAYNAAAQGITYGGLLILGDTSAYAFFKANSSLLVDGTHPGVTGSIDLGNYWEAASGATIANDMLSAMGRATITLGALASAGTGSFAAPAGAAVNFSALVAAGTGSFATMASGAVNFATLASAGTGSFATSASGAVTLGPTAGGGSGFWFAAPFHLPYEYTSVPIPTGNINPFDIDPEQTTLISTGNVNPFDIDPERTTVITVGLTSSD